MSILPIRIYINLNADFSIKMILGIFAILSRGKRVQTDWHWGSARTRTRTRTRTCQYKEPAYHQPWYWPGSAWEGFVLVEHSKVTVKPTSNISHTKSQHLNVFHLILQVSLPNPLKPGVKLRTKMWLEKRRQAMLQLHLSDQQFYCLLRFDLYKRFNSKQNCCWKFANYTMKINTRSCDGCLKLSLWLVFL